MQGNLNLLFKTYTTGTVMAWNWGWFDRWREDGAFTGALVVCAGSGLSGCSKNESSPAAPADAGPWLGRRQGNVLRGVGQCGAGCNRGEVDRRPVDEALRLREG